MKIGPDNTVLSNGEYRQNKIEKFKKKSTKKQADTNSSVAAIVDHSGSEILGEQAQLPASASAPDTGREKPKITRIREYIEANYELRYDVVANDIEWRSRKPNTQPHTFEVLNEDTLLVELLEVGYTGIKEPLNALLRSSWVPEYNPIYAYFEELPPWTPDKPDYIAQLSNYVTANDQEWFLNQYRKMFVRTIACGLGFIPFNKHCFLLIGKQHDGKSSFVRFHCPPALNKYYTEQIDFENKDGQIALSGNLFINLDELSNFSKVDINKCKAFMTTDKIKVRHPFGSKPKISQRRASFLGSTNQRDFLTDQTGNVRWLIMDVQEIRHDDGGEAGYARNVDINNVWAQAYALLKSGFKYQMTKDEIAQSEMNNKRYMRVTPEMELVRKHLLIAKPKGPKAEYLMAGEIVQRFKERYNNRININDNNMGKALTASGFLAMSGRRSDCANPISAYWVEFFN